ncbi:MAG: diacylglycerol kinase family lipid kinase [Pseudomonadales bacterium]|nr:diacylglycerol kinase family lipid kinase [Pseudomonadales bacterium]
MEHWYVICNPVSGRRSGHSNRRRLEHGLRAVGIAHEIALTEYPEHACELARAACRNGWRRIAIAGGDGTAHQVVNGILGSGIGDLAQMMLGVLPLGTGNDWARTLGVPADVDSACRILGAGQAVLHDVGEVALRIDGQAKTRHFINMAGAGFDAHVVRLVQTRGDRHWRYITGLLQGAHNFQAPELTISAAGFRHEGPTLVAFLNIGRYLGGGMRVAPQAQFDDGLFELTVVRSMRLPRLLANLPRLALGNLAGSHLVSVARAASVSIEGDTLIEADGELLGRTPANFRIIARAMRVVVPRPDKHAQF